MYSVVAHDAGMMRLSERVRREVICMRYPNFRSTIPIHIIAGCQDIRREGESGISPTTSPQPGRKDKQVSKSK